MLIEWRAGLFHLIFCWWIYHAKKYLTQSDLRFCEYERSKRSKINEKGVNWIENQGENLYKMLKIC